MRRAALLGAVLGGVTACAPRVPEAPRFGPPSGLVGHAAPALRGEGVDGEGAVDVGAWRGRPVVVVFFSLDCAPCAEEQPLLAWVARAAGERARFVGVASSASAEAVRAWRAARGGAAFPVLLDGDGALAGAFGVEGFPEHFALGADGRVRSHVRGRAPLPWLVEATGGPRR